MKGFLFRTPDSRDSAVRVLETTRTVLTMSYKRIKTEPGRL
jgi:hypothetical protein